MMRALVMLVLVTGCSATPYQPKGLFGGFSEERLSQRQWELNVIVNSLTTQERTRWYVLRRAAELTLSSGYQAFYFGNEHVSAQCHQFKANWTQCQLTVMMLSALEAPTPSPGVFAHDARTLTSQIPPD